MSGTHSLSPILHTLSLPSYTYKELQGGLILTSTAYP
jgi:hypothetical protein